MKKTLKSLFETGVLHLAVFCLIFALALVVSGCSVTKVNYEKDDTGKVSYRLYRNDHWLKTSGTGISGGMTKDGKFEFAADGLEKSPSEEFNRTMMTYTSAVVQLMQIAAAAYNPAASLAAQGADPTAVAKLTEAQSAAKTAEISAKSQRETANIKAASEASIAAKQAESATASANCPNGECQDGDCPDGNCEAK